MLLVVTKLNQTHQFGGLVDRSKKKGRPPLFQNPNITISCKLKPQISPKSSLEHELVILIARGLRGM
ncbi:hypothetical protein HanHA300_Chr05g0165131 [Helianthus annuus]|nr:hypothetical protein HanHA300_Chr05g0165131 [Helianthus annuus]KAJ0749388.1 hypothetical protein HanLR1_Chr05g0169261 [Helianthus annuus]